MPYFFQSRAATEFRSHDQ